MHDPDGITVYHTAPCFLYVQKFEKYRNSPTRASLPRMKFRAPLVQPTMSRFALIFVNLALVSGQAVNPVAKVISLLSDMQATIQKEAKAEDARITKFNNNCELRSAELQYLNSHL